MHSTQHQDALALFGVMTIDCCSPGQFGDEGEPDGEGELQLANGDTYNGQFVRYELRSAARGHEQCRSSKFEGAGKFCWITQKGRQYQGAKPTVLLLADAGG